MAVKLILAAIVSYLLGCIHPAYFFARIKGKGDIREQGTNNSGTSNATIVLGIKFGIATFIIDFLKGTAALLITRYCISDTPVFLYVAFTFAFLGHIFPFYLKLRGGKGLAVTLGAAMGLNPVLCVGLSFALILMAVITQYLVVGTVTVAVLFAVYSGAVYGFLSVPFALALFMCSLMLFLHKSNYVKIYKKEEPRLFDVLGINKKKDNKKEL